MLTNGSHKCPLEARGSKVSKVLVRVPLVHGLLSTTAIPDLGAVAAPAAIPHPPITFLLHLCCYNLFFSSLFPLGKFSTALMPFSTSFCTRLLAKL